MRLHPLIILFLFTLPIWGFGQTGVDYPWLESYSSEETIHSRIPTPKGYTRLATTPGSFARWLQYLPLKPEDTPTKLWDGELKWNQTQQAAVVDLDFIGKNLQQCIDVIIRLRAEYLWSKRQTESLAFSYTCCREPVSWSKWRAGWRTKIVKKGGLDAYEWVKSAKADDSQANFHRYLYSIMNYAGTYSLARDMTPVDSKKVRIGDAFVQGGAPGNGHGVLIVDMAVSAEGKTIMLLGQSYNPAQNFEILKNPSKPSLSPWFEVDFDSKLFTPEWTFQSDHARRFE